MPRAADGTVTMVVGNPVVDDTAITADWANRTLADLAAMIEDSLSRSGFGGMLAVLQFADGTVAAPGISFSLAPGTGVYRDAGTGELRIAVSGANVLTLSNVTVPTLNNSLHIIGSLQTGGAILVDAGGLSVTAGPVSLPAQSIQRNALPDVGEQISNSSGLFTYALLPFVDVTNLTVTITTTGRPVRIALQPDGTANPSTIAQGAGGSGFLNLLRDGGLIANWEIGANMLAPVSSISYVQRPGAGTYVYKFQASSGFGGTLAVSYAKLIAYEL